MHGVGHWRRQVELTDLLSHIPRNQLDRGLHFRNDPLGFVDPVHACLTEAFVLRNGANGVHLRLDICRNELAVSPHAALHIDKVVGLTDAPNALGDLRSLGADALELLARRLRFPFELLQAGSGLWGATRPPFCRRVARTLQLPLSSLKPLLRLGGRLARRPLLGLVAMGPQTALTSSCCTWKRSGEWCTPRACSTYASKPGASSLVD